MTIAQVPGNRIACRVPRDVPVGVSGIELEMVATDAGDLWIPVKDDVIRQYMRHAGNWEREVGRAILASMPESGGVFLDIGAHVGYFSCLVARSYPTCSIHAFEPNPDIYRVLALNAWQAGAHVTPWPLALQAGRGNVSIVETVYNTGDARAKSGHDGIAAAVVAPASDLDGLLPDLRADVVKVDVQGAELDVIRGMSGVIARSENLRVILEYSPDLLEERSIDPRSALQMLRGFGFGIAVINEDRIFEAGDSEIISLASSMGRDGHVNILLHKE